jgi:hypothetical protein
MVGVAVSRISFAVLIVACFLLTAYFGVAAWHTATDQSEDITGQVFPPELNGWQRPLPRR